MVDSAEDICGAVQEVLLKRPIPPVEFSFLKGYIGRHLFELFDDLGIAEPEWDVLLAEYRGIYAARKHSSTRPYPGAVEGIASLGGRKATATTKGTPTTRIVLEQFGFLPYFDHVQGTDGFPAKAGAARCVRRAQRAQCRGGGLPVCGAILRATWKPAGAPASRSVRSAMATARRKELARFQPDYWIDDPARAHRFCNGTIALRKDLSRAGPEGQRPRSVGGVKHYMRCL